MANKRVQYKTPHNNPKLLKKTAGTIKAQPRPRSVVDDIKDGIVKASKQFKTEPYNVSSAQFWSVAGDSIPEWQVRKVGGFTGQRDTLFPAPIEAKSESSVLPRNSGKQKKIKLVNTKIENFTVHQTDMKEIFKICGLKENDIMRVVVQPDTHTPEHDVKAMETFCEFLKFYKPHGLINLGDFMEMGSVSHWPSNDGSPKVFSEDVKSAKEVLEQIDRAAGPQCVYKRFIIGNHEDWLNQLLVNKVPEFMYGIEDHGVQLRIQDILGLKDFGYRVIPLNEILRLGDAHFIHGYYTSKNHASKHLDVFGCNIYYGHLHDVQSFSGVSVKGMHEAASLGCLRGLQAPFMKGKPNNWSHALGIFEFNIDGTYTRYIPIMVNGKFTFNGKKFGFEE